MNGIQTAWAEIHRNYNLPDGEVHVWRVDLRVATSDFVKLREILSPDERERADRFHFDVDRERSVIARGYLRLLLARILGSSPASFQFKYGEFGKPRLLANREGVQFNLSHSGDIILIAVARGREVGVDIEKIRLDLEIDEIADRYLSTNERNALATLVGPERYRAFFTCWTRKEAYLKARGVGLSLSLDQFDVSFLPGDEPRLLATWSDPPDAQRWRLKGLNVGPCYCAAVLAGGQDWELKCWEGESRSLLGALSCH